jgi:hypothetical protein
MQVARAEKVGGLNAAQTTTAETAEGILLVPLHSAEEEEKEETLT